MKNFYIPKKIVAGFQSRKDTFTEKLAYIIYYDNIGKLRKEKSWEGWRNDKIPKMEILNEPTSGFVLNKGIQRCNWGHFSSNRSMIRIYDPRGLEFEITPQNLVWILMHVDCSKREIQDKLVYAWDGTELLLLPSSSEEYKEATQYTDLQGVKFSARDLKKGHTYITKQGEEHVYIGFFSYWDWKYNYNVQGRYGKNRTSKKYHIFCDPLKSKKDDAHYSPKFFPIRSVSSKIAKCISEQPHNNYANLVDEWVKREESTEIVKFKLKKIIKETWDKFKKGGYNSSDKIYLYENNEYYQCNVNIDNQYIKSYKVTFNRHARIIPARRYSSYVYQATPSYELGETYKAITDPSIFGTLIKIGKNGEHYE